MGVLELGMFVGLGAVSVWLYVHYPRLRPRTILRAAVHVAASFVLFFLLPNAVDLCAWALPAPLSLVVFVVGLMIPVFCYVLFSWLNLMARLYDLADFTPRGGHPAHSPS